MAKPHKPPAYKRPRLVPPAPIPQPHYGALNAGGDALGLALWQSLRNVLIWSKTPEPQRARLFRRVNVGVRVRFTAARAAAPALAEALDAFEWLQASPALSDPARVAAACSAVREWAERVGKWDVASLFADAAAYAEPDFPRWPVLAGYAARTIGGAAMLWRADAWYDRACVLSARENDPRNLVIAKTGTGAVLKARGDFNAALVAYEDAARRARKSGRRRQAAQVRHYLAALSGGAGDLDGAVRHATAALNLYPLHDERLPYLAHDVGYVLLRLNYFRTALRLLDAAAARMDRPHELALVLASIARAAAGAGRRTRYRAACRAALGLIRLHREHAHTALVNLTEAARLAGEWERAGKYAAWAEREAREQQEAEVWRLAREAGEAVARREPPAPAAVLPEDAPVAALARLLAARLRKWRTRGRGIRINRPQSGSVHG